MVRWFVICVAFAAGACERHGEAELQRVRDAVCTCKTASCADQAMKSLPPQDIASNPKTQRIAREMMDCLAKLYENGRPSTDPDGPIQEASGPPPPAPPPKTP